METLKSYVREYTIQLKKGEIQKAYKGIMTFMNGLKGYLERKYTDYHSSVLYFGYMDMTYFALTPTALKDRKLKIAIVFLHEECRFELWLAGNNRKVQADYIALLEQKDMGRYTLSKVHPGVDSIIALAIVEQPDFDNPEGLKIRIEENIGSFINDIMALLE